MAKDNRLKAWQEFIINTKERIIVKKESLFECAMDSMEEVSLNIPMRLDFQPADYDFYLNRDIMSFLVGVVQRHFPEYECCGRLV